MTDFEEGIKSKNRRTQLEALRDLVTHELTVHRCKTCQAMQLRTGDTAALVLRLQKILEELAQIPEQQAEQSEYEKIQAQVAAKVASGGTNNVVFPFGSKSSPRRQGARRKTTQAEES